MRARESLFLPPAARATLVVVVVFVLAVAALELYVIASVVGTNGQ